LIAAGAVYWLSRIPVDGSYLSNLMPPLLIMAFGLGWVFVGVNTAANAGVPPDKAGLAAALINTSTWLGGALGLAIFSVIADTRTHDLLARHASASQALTSGFQRALTACAVFLAGAALIALRAAIPRASPRPRTSFPSRRSTSTPDGCFSGQLRRATAGAARSRSPVLRA